MVEFTRNSIPTIWKGIQDFLGYSDAYKQRDSTEMYAAKQHLGPTYSRNTFYQIVALTRMRNGQHFSYWASIGTAAAYANSSSETSSRIPSFFGLISSWTTLSRNWKAFSSTKVLYKSIHSSLLKCTVRYQDATMFTPADVFFFIAVFDNLQKNVPFKFQRFGATSHFVKVTSRMFLWAWQQGAWRDAVMPIEKVALTYVDQAIPSPFGMPAFELSPILTSLLIGSHDTIAEGLKAFEHSLEADSTPSAVDFSGTRVKSYLQHTRIANELVIQKTIISCDKA
jgi:hypothetical protein